ncbi:MAG: hypothetical protein ACO3RV_07030 [Luteolibacter sp.]
MLLSSGHQTQACAAFVGMWMAAGFCQADGTADPVRLQNALAQLTQRNEVLQQSLAEANRAEKTATQELVKVRERLEALGKNLLDGGDDRLVQAAADLQIAQERIAALEVKASEVTAAILECLSQAIISNPQQRLQLETRLRELDALVGMRHKPSPDVRTGSLQQARLVSIDQQSGMLVLNIGESHGAKIGMRFQLSRGQEPYAIAVLADVRHSVSGLFIESMSIPEFSPNPGDIATLQTQAPAE